MPALLDHRWRWWWFIRFGRFDIFDNGLVHCPYVTEDNVALLLVVCSACQAVADRTIATKKHKKHLTEEENILCFLCLFVAKKASVDGATSEPVFWSIHTQNTGASPHSLESPVPIEECL
jgi:hypothetical protein